MMMNSFSNVIREKTTYKLEGHKMRQLSVVVVLLQIFGNSHFPTLEFRISWSRYFASSPAPHHHYPPELLALLTGVISDPPQSWRSFTPTSSLRAGKTDMWLSSELFFIFWSLHDKTACFITSLNSQLVGF